MVILIFHGTPTMDAVKPDTVMTIFFEIMAALKRAFGVELRSYEPGHLLGAGVFGDGLGALRDGVLGQFTGEEKPDGSLDLPGGDGGPLVVVGKAGSLSRDSFEDVIDERVHDGHGLGGNASVRVNLLQHLVDVDGIGFLSLLLLFLVAGGAGSLGLAGLLCTFG